MIKPRKKRPQSLSQRRAKQREINLKKGREKAGVGVYPESKKGEHTLSSLAKLTIKDFVSSKQLKEIYLEYLPTIERLVWALARDYVDRRSELKQYALIGIWAALCQHKDKCSPGIIYNSIKTSIKHAAFEDIDNYTPTVSRPSYRKYTKARKQYIELHGHEPSNQQLADHMGISIVFVHEHFLARSYSHQPYEFHEQSSAHCDKSFINLKIETSSFYGRKQEYEDRLIYWIDRRWLKGMMARLDEQTLEALDVYTSDVPNETWSKAHNKYPTYVLMHANKGLMILRVAENHGYRWNDDESPRQFLKRQGYNMKTIWKMVTTRNYNS